MPLFNGPPAIIIIIIISTGAQQSCATKTMHNKNVIRVPISEPQSPWSFRRPLFLGPQAVNADSTMHYRRPGGFRAYLR